MALGYIMDSAGHPVHILNYLLFPCRRLGSHLEEDGLPGYMHRQLWGVWKLGSFLCYYLLWLLSTPSSLVAGVCILWIYG